MAIPRPGQYCEFSSPEGGMLVHNAVVVAAPVTAQMTLTPGGIAIVVGILLVMVAILLFSLRHRPRGRP